MFAILITDENLENISTLPTVSENDVLWMKNNLHKERYFISGFVHTSGAMQDWTVFPSFILKAGYEYDKQKIQSDWDQIVRK